jgi:redox-sensing transcriptional repressor
MKKQIPIPSIERLSAIYMMLEEMEAEGVEKVSSKEIAARIGAQSHNVRKDINYFGEIGNARAGYVAKKLKAHLSAKLGFNKPKKACVVGIGRLGAAILFYNRLAARGFSLVAGFDSNVNKLETLQTEIPLFPAHEITEVVRRKAIELAALAVPAAAAQEAAGKLIEGGIKGIVNFTPFVIKPPKGVFVRNMDLVGEFRVLSALSNITF